MPNGDKRKQSLYFPANLLKDVQNEAVRLDRSLSWIVQRCIKHALPKIRELKGSDEVEEYANMVSEQRGA